MHRPALAINGPAMGDALFERGALSKGAYSGQQRGLEPAAVLVKTLEIHCCGPEVLVLLHGSKVGGTGVEPTVQSVLFLREPLVTAAVRADEALGQDLARVTLKPGIGAVFAKELGDRGDTFVRNDGLAAVGAIENRDRQTPLALAGDTPVAALADHGLHAVDTPTGHPAHIVAGLAGLVLKGLYGAEPLRGRAEDD